MKNKEAKNKLVAVVRIRGRVNVRGSITETLKRLNLKRVSNCTIIKATDSYMGMLNKCSNYVAYGEIDPETLGKLMENRAKKQITFKPNEVFESKYDSEEFKELLPFRLHPPTHGYKSTKLGFAQGGSLGYMGKDINKLLNRMI